MGDALKRRKAAERKPDLPTSEFKSASTIIKETTGAIKELSTVYDKIGFAGTLTVSAIVLGIVTIIFTYLSGTMIGDEWRLGTTLQEEILFACIAIAFAALGTVFLIQKNSKESQRQLLAMEIERERNRYIHEETVAKLRLQGSTGQAQGDQTGATFTTSGLSNK